MTVFTMGTRFNTRNRQGALIEMQEVPALLARDFFNMGADIRSYKEPLEETRDKVLIPHINRMFDTEGDEGAFGAAFNGWSPLAPVTVRERGATGPILNRTGRLRKGAVAKARFIIQGRIGTGTGAVMYDVMSHPAPYAPLQFFSSSTYGDTGRPFAKITSFIEQPTSESFAQFVPARPWMVMSNALAEESEDIFYNWLDKKIAWLTFVGGRRTPNADRAGTGFRR